METRHDERRGRAWMYLFVAAAVLLGAVRWHIARQPPGLKPVAERRVMGALELQQLGGGEWKLADHRGEVVLINYWATWCEPCKRFHEAVQRGALDPQFGNLRLVEFDLDKDGDRLRDAGYAPKLIPLLALPAKDGFATGEQMEGSVKGDGAVDQMTPRLAALLQKS